MTNGTNINKMKGGANMLRVLTTMSKDEGLILARKLSVDHVSNLNGYNEKLLKSIQQFVASHVGFDVQPIATVSRMYDEPVDIEESYEYLGDFLPVTAGRLILELTLPKDLCVSIDFETILNLNSRYNKYSNDEFELELLNEELHESLKVGSIEDADNVITFVPYLNVKHANRFLVLTEEWSGENFELAGIPQVKLKSMNIF